LTSTLERLAPLHQSWCLFIPPFGSVGNGSTVGGRDDDDIDDIEDDDIDDIEDDDIDDIDDNDDNDDDGGGGGGGSDCDDDDKDDDNGGGGGGCRGCNGRSYLSLHCISSLCSPKSSQWSSVSALCRLM
jgi:hypothetical protein